MKIKIDSRKENALFSRVDIRATAFDFSSTPSRMEVVNELAKEIGVDAGGVVVNQIKQPFGSKSAKIEARVYPSTETASKAEPAYKFARGKSKEVKSAA